MLNFIIDKDIEFKQLEISDSEALFNLTEKNRKYLKEWLPWLDSTQTVNDTKDFIQGTIEKSNGNKAFDLGIWYKNNLVGTIGLHEINWEKEQTAIGYWIDQNYQGLGLMTKACKVIISYTFDQFKLKKILIRCGSENLKSQAIPKRLGLRQVGIIEQSEFLYDHFVDHIVYEITDKEYKERKAEFNIAKSIELN